MKSKMVCLICAFMMCCTMLVHAEETNYNVNEVREQAETSWQAVYETQWRDVEISITPTVPDVSAMPVLMVRPAYWVPSTERDVIWVAEGIGAEQGGDAFSLDADYVYDAENQAMKGKKVTHVDEFIYAPLNRDAAYAPSNDLTINGMIQQVESILTDVDHSHFGIDTEHFLHVRVSSKVNKDTGELLLPGLLSLEIHTTIRDIPIWGHVIESVSSHKDDELWYHPKLIFSMRTPSSFSLFGSTVCETTEIVADTPLCSFELVREAIEQEIESGHIRAVYSVDLGYALYNVPGTSRKPGKEWMKAAEFYVVPAWRCVCLYSKQAKKDLPADALNDPATSKYYTTLYVNAKTGKMIDPNDGHRGCGDYPGVALWDEVKE